MGRLNGMTTRYPSGLEEYLDTYGWHFSKKLCQWAVSKMRVRSAETGEPVPLEEVNKSDIEVMFRRYGIEPSDFIAYDAVYVYHMAVADYMNRSIVDEKHLVFFVRDYLDDIDGYEDKAMTRFYADCIGRGEMPPWEDVL